MAWFLVPFSKSRLLENVRKFQFQTEIPVPPNCQAQIFRMRQTVFHCRSCGFGLVSSGVQNFRIPPCNDFPHGKGGDMEDWTAFAPNHSGGDTPKDSDYLKMLVNTCKNM
jgi:hypothetical protein